jgi:hypothetical protein
VSHYYPISFFSLSQEEAVEEEPSFREDLNMEAEE